MVTELYRGIKMIALIQRVSQAKVDVNCETIGEIGKGLLVLLGVEKEDNQEKADKLAEKVLNYRIFSDENDKMNLNSSNKHKVNYLLFLNLH